MKFKNYFLIICLIICLFSIASVVASDVNETLATNEDNDELIEIENLNDEVKSNEQNNEDNIGATEENKLTASIGTFTKLNTDIANAGDEFNLTNDYIYSTGDSNYKQGITINKKITINGNGHVINGCNQARAFKISFDNVVLNNISFVNCSASSNGGAISLFGSHNNTIIGNCSFINCSASSGGGTIYLTGSKNILDNCSFINFAPSRSSSIYLTINSNNNIICYCSFINFAPSSSSIYLTTNSNNNIIGNCSFINFASSGSRAIHLSRSTNNILGNCSFINCSSEYGGAIELDGSNNILGNCSFINCSSQYGGAIYLVGSNNNILGNCSFINCSSEYGGAIYLFGSNNNILGNCSFINCSSNKGGAIYCDSNSYFINCYFEYCYGVYSYSSSIKQPGYGGAIYLNGRECKILNSNFSKCNIKSSDGAGDAIYWYGDDGIISNCMFIDCINDHYTIFWTGDNGLINNTFFNTYDKSVYVPNDLIITKVDVKIDCNNVSFKYMDINNFKLCLKDYFNNNLKNKKINFENKELRIYTSSFTDKDGIVRLPVELTKFIGNFCINVSFDGDDNYNSKQSSFNLNITPSESHIVVTDCSGKVSNETTINVKVINSNNMAVNEGIVTFFENNTQIGNSSINNGIASLRYTPTKSGEQIIYVKFHGSNFIDSNNTLTIHVDKGNTEIIFNKLENIYYNIPSTFSIDILSNNQLINEGIVRFYIDNHEIKYLNVSNGHIVFNYTFTSLGTFSMLAIFNETNNYLTSYATIACTVSKMPVIVYSSNLNTVYNMEEDLVATLKDIDGKILKDVKLTITLNGKTYTPTTDENGQVKISTSGLVPNTFTAKITFNGNTMFSPSTKEVKITVKKATPKITAAKKNFKAKTKTKKYTIILKNNVGKAMNKVKVTLKIGKKTYSAKTNTKGKATFKIKKLTKKSKYNAVITYKGDKYYNKVTKKVKINIK